MTNPKSHSKQYARFLKLLLKTGEVGLSVELGNLKAIITFNGRIYSFPDAVFFKARADNAIDCIEHTENNDKHILITDIGKIIARKLLHPELEFQSPHQEWTVSSKDEIDAINAGGFGKINRNLSESPLMRLYTRKDKNGQAYLTHEELAAGEKLRTDFERANLQPSITANLQSFVTGKSGGDIGNQYAAMTDFAIDNRANVEKAVAALGPELSGIALDICCFLKGLELVERERRWPPRPAKLMLKTALSILSRHYGFSQSYSRAAGKVEHWGGDGYRPDINSG